MVLNGLFGSCLVLFYPPALSCMVLYGMNSMHGMYGILWSCIVLLCFIWSCMVLNFIVRHVLSCTIFYCPVWPYMVLYGHIYSYMVLLKKRTPKIFLKNVFTLIFFKKIVEIHATAYS